MTIITIDAAKKPDERYDVPKFRPAVVLDFSKLPVQLASAGGIIGFGLIAMKFVSWLKDIR